MKDSDRLVLLLLVMILRVRLVPGMSRGLPLVVFSLHDLPLTHPLFTDQLKPYAKHQDVSQNSTAVGKSTFSATE